MRAAFMRALARVGGKRDYSRRAHGVERRGRDRRIEGHERGLLGLVRICRGLGALGLEFVPSHANFLLVRFPDAAAAYQRLLEQGVIVRPVANYGLPDYLRVTVGLPAENQRFIDAVAALLSG